MSRLSKVFLMYPETAARDAMALIQNHPDRITQTIMSEYLQK